MANANSSIEDLLENKLNISNVCPYLDDSETIEYIKKSKIMFINRYKCLYKIANKNFKLKYIECLDLI